jgi:hypothetical protein
VGVVVGVVEVVCNASGDTVTGPYHHTIDYLAHYVAWGR